MKNTNKSKKPTSQKVLAMILAFLMVASMATTALVVIVDSLAH
jgi:hypothetical protein